MVTIPGNILTFDSGMIGVITWTVNKLIIPGETSNTLNWTVPPKDTDLSNNIFEIRATNGIQHKEWIESTLSISEAPIIYDTFHDNKYNGRIEKDPWGRNLPTWNILGKYSQDVSNGYLMNTSTLAYTWFVCPTNVVYGTFEYKFYMPSTSPQTGAVNFFPLYYSDSYSAAGDPSCSNYCWRIGFTNYQHAWTYMGSQLGKRWFFMNDVHWDNGAGDYTINQPGVGYWDPPYNTWITIRWIITKEDGKDIMRLYFKKPSMNDFQAIDAGQWEIPNTTFKREYNESISFAMIGPGWYVDDVKVYDNVYLYPKKEINIYNDKITLKGTDITIEDIDTYINDSSIFSFDPINRIVNVYKSIDVTPGTHINFSNVKIIMNEPTSGTTNWYIGPSSKLSFNNVSIESSNILNYYDFIIPTTTHPHANTYTMNNFISNTYQSKNGYNWIDLQNVTLKNARGLEFDGFVYLKMRDCTFDNLFYDLYKLRISKSNVGYLDIDGLTIISNSDGNNDFDILNPADPYGLYNNPIKNLKFINNSKINGANTICTLPGLNTCGGYVNVPIHLVNPKLDQTTISGTLLINKYYYVDVSVVDLLQNSINNAIVTIENLTDPSKLPISLTPTWYEGVSASQGNKFIKWNPPNKINNFITDSTGHTPKPRDINDAIVLEQGNYKITATYNNVSNSSTVFIDNTWYRNDPLIPEKNVAIQLDTITCPIPICDMTITQIYRKE